MHPATFDRIKDELRSERAGCPDQDVLVELLAELCHEAWSGWTGWLFEKWDADHASGEPYQARWLRQLMTDYADLSDPEKESDRIEARKIVALLRAQGIV